MEIYQTEEEQVDALKAWWDQKGKSLLLTLAAALVAVFGVNTWMERQQQMAEAASLQYQRMIGAFEASGEEAVTLGRAVIENHPSSHYATLAALRLAKAAVEENDTTGAENQLQWVAANSDQAIFTDVARTRLARLMLSDQRPDEALTQLDQVTTDSLRAVVDEIRGDVMLQKGERTAARSLYVSALSGYAEVPSKRQLMQMKIDDLAPATK